MFNLLNISKEYFDIFKKLYKDKKKYVRGILKPNELYTEIIKYYDLLKRAELRNQMFIKKLEEGDK